ncbi:hypothetical protein [Rhodococcus rhodochrous]|uniref:hypothetical protein n=1 Tax=Rhodococcus rhodochrous TaxID=1829 RepID=UPI0023FA1757
MAKKGSLSKKWKIAGGVAVVVLLLGVAGSCAADDLKTELGWSQADPLKSEWVGTIISTDVLGRLPTADIDFGESTRTITLARVQAPSCGEDGDRAVQALRARLADLLPAGTAVRVARASFGSFNTLDSSSGYVFTSAPLAATTTVSPPTTSVTGPVSSAPPAPSTTAASATSTAPAVGGSANEVLLAEGHGSIADPDLDFSIAASTPLDEQIAAATTYLGGDTAQFALLVSASQSAWDSSAGSQAACRVADQPRVDEKLRRDEEARIRDEKERIRREQQAQLDALRAGADGQIGTSDDDETQYYFNANGELDIRPDYSSPSYSGGGGGGGGESRFCRKRWWC